MKYSLNIHQVEKIIIQEDSYNRSRWVRLHLTGTDGDEEEISIFNSLGEMPKVEDQRIHYAQGLPASMFAELKERINTIAAEYGVPSSYIRSLRGRVQALQDLLLGKEE